VSNKKIVIVGYSGHAYVVLDAIIQSGNIPIYYSDKNINQANPYKLEYIGFENDIHFTGWGMNFSFVICIGDNYLRQKIGELIVNKLEDVGSVIHPNSSISQFATIGKGVFVSKGVMVNPFSKIGDFVILNTGCIIEHECVISDYAHIAPGAVLAGNVVIGRRSFIGANAVIKQGVVVGDDVIVGAGSVVLKDIPNNSKVVGNPSKNI